MRLRTTNETLPTPLKLVHGSNPDEPRRPDGARKASAKHVQGNVQAWVAQHWDVVYKLLDRLTGNRHDAEDLAQETFLRAMERHDSFEPGTNLRAWLLRIGTNAFLDRQRRRKVVKVVGMPDDDAVEPASGAQKAASPTRDLELRELHEAALAAIGKLPETPRVVFLLRTEQEMSFRDIAEVIGTSEETARWHMMQARKQLLARLDGKLD